MPHPGRGDAGAAAEIGEAVNTGVQAWPEPCDNCTGCGELGNDCSTTRCDVCGEVFTGTEADQVQRLEAEVYGCTKCRAELETSHG
jgi:hypothetical protein